jgi:hypothetical protein
MKRGRHIITVLLAAIALPALVAAQTRSLSLSALPDRPGTAQGQLTVTLTVVSSVGVVMDASGQPKLIVANAPDPADNVSALNKVRLANTLQAPQKQQKKKK